MKRAPRSFRETDVKRVVKATQAAGVKVGSVKVLPDGAIQVFAADAPARNADSQNEWDSVK